MRRTLSLLLMLLLLVLPLCPTALAADSITIDDGADLFTEEEERSLAERYAVLAEYAPVAVVTTRSPGTGTEKFAENYAIAHYGNDRAVIFVIDMQNREVCLYANGSALKTISKADSRAITDNVYSYASRGQYYSCADASLSQVLTRFRGGLITRPVKHITNGLIAVLFAVLINYLAALSSRRPQKNNSINQEASALDLFRSARVPKLAVEAKLVSRVITGTASSDSDSDSSGSGSSGGGSRSSSGGGGHVGGGGSHRF